MGKTNQYSYGSPGSGASKLLEMLNGAGVEIDSLVGAVAQAAIKKNQQNNGTVADVNAGNSSSISLGGTGSSNATPKTANKNTGFTYDDYIESDVVKEAKDALDTQLSKKPGDYTSKWQTQLDDIYNKIMNREDFSYDFNQDALYQQYKDKYIQQGKMAMADTMGQASAMTGGYGNSYAQSVGQQAYNAQLQNLNDVIPELYQMAYDKYNREGEDLYNQYALTMEQDQTDYGRYRDSVSDWMSERDYLAGRYDTERDFDYSKYAYDKDFAYTDHRNAIADEQWQKEFDEGVRQFNQNYDLQDRQVDIQEKEYNLKEAAANKVDESTHKAYAGTTPEGKNYNNGGLTTAQIKELQAELGVKVDGYYGDDAKEKAGGLSAKEAYEKFVGKIGSGDDTDPDGDDDTDPDGDDDPVYDYAYVEDMIQKGINNPYQPKSESWVSGTLRDAWKAGYITDTEYTKLKNKYVSLTDHQYTTGSGGRYTR